MAIIDKYNFSGKRALIRVDFNVPMDKNTLTITDYTRIKAAIPTIRKVLENKSRESNRIMSRTSLS